MMRSISLLFIVFFVSAFNSESQITVSNSLTPTQLVQDVLLGSGVSVFNVQFSGSSIQRGTFTGTSNIGIDDGVILATGDIQLAPGPNASGSETLGSGVGGDPDLATITGSTTYDAAVLEFDFVPSSDTVRFFYVFASEEYPEYVCSEFNDVFAFFLSGPNPLGGTYVKKNIAIIPGTTIPVAINSINPGATGSSGVPGGCTSLAYSALYTDNSSGATIEYDGFTHVLEASALVIACDTYHIKIAIADVLDGNYDAGVFLKAKSFSSPAVSISAVGSSFDSTMVEGCGAATYIFTRGGDIANPFTIDYIIGGTAINGIDYTDLSGNSIGTSVTFAVGEDSAFLYIDPVNDAISETTETITLAIPQVISCTNDTLSATIYITNVDPMQISLTGDTVICVENGESSILNVDFTGGYGPFDYLWDNGLGNTSQVVVSPVVPTLFTISIQDSCGNESAQQSILIVNECDVLTTNVITPNGDGFNDFLVFPNLEQYPNSQLFVYNRWGKIVYQNLNYANDWSPTELSDGTYYYILKKSAGIEHTAEDYHGTITVLKSR